MKKQETRKRGEEEKQSRNWKLIKEAEGG